MDSTILYLGYCQMGRETFLEKANASLVLRRAADPEAKPTAETSPLDLATFTPATTQVAAGVSAQDGTSIHVYPLVKNPGSAFADMITVGRTPNNDVHIPHKSVSRFHVFFRRDPDGWIICDSGSMNGTRVNDKKLTTRTDTKIASGAIVQLGDVLGTFYCVEDLFAVLEPFVDG